MTERTDEPHHVSTEIETVIAEAEKRMAQTPPEEVERRRKESEERKRLSDEARSNDLLIAGNPPKRQLLAIDLDRTGQWGATERKLIARIGSGFLVCLAGTRGAGKTQLGVELMRATARAFKRPRFSSGMKFFMEIKSGYDGAGPTEKQVLLEFGRPALLVMDEIGVRSESEWENRLLTELINDRYADMRDTLLISNQRASDLERALGPSIVSRMRETGGIIECTWKSFRL